MDAATAFPRRAQETKWPLLSGANAALGKARGLWMQQAGRNQTTAVKQAVRSWVELWTPASGTRRKRRK
jgi:hypothetical protein